MDFSTAPHTCPQLQNDFAEEPLEASADTGLQMSIITQHTYEYMLAQMHDISEL